MIERFATITDNARTAGQEILGSGRRGPRSYLPFLGPAIIASVAYMDPGNFATNIQGGAQFGYTLLWVVLAANIVAMLFQSLSAKLGIVTGKSLAVHCREQLPKPLAYCLWIASEIAAIATDLAEVLGGAIALTLLFGLPLLVSCVIVGVITYAILLFEGGGFRPMEIAIGAFVSIIGFSYVAELLVARPDWLAAGSAIISPNLAGPESIALAVGIVGATVMPHAIYLHSSLMTERIVPKNDAERGRLLRFSNHEVLLALSVAGLVNMAMVVMAAVVFNATGHADVATIETAYHTLTPLLGISAAGIFMLSLLASGLSSSVVGTMAGQRIMQDFVDFPIPLWVRRAVTLIPALVIVGIGVDTTWALIVSQIVLSLVLPIPALALTYVTSRRDIMGGFANSGSMTLVASIATAAIIALNAYLLWGVATSI